MKTFYLSLIIFILGACGHTTPIKNSNNSNMKINISQYDTVIINDFSDHISESKNEPYILNEGKNFADLISFHINSKKIFKHVKRNVHSNEPALLIDGSITELNEGNAAGRLLIGLGVGSSHFDAVINIKANETKKVLGTITADKNSWALGGVLAATQDVKSIMIEVADKIANELKLAKNKP